MALSEVRIREAHPAEPLPIDLLLLADPSADLVQEYAKRGRLFLAESEGEVIGVAVLIQTRPATQELINVAVHPDRQGEGIGKSLVLHAIAVAREAGAQTLELGTGNSSLAQLGLYQKCGFRIVGVDRDFFVRHYAEPIVENGILCLDMIRLSLDL